jgi:putative oxidoreductase
VGGHPAGMAIGRLTARVVIGGLFVGHGTQKLFGWFGGPGIEGTEQMMGSLEMYPTRHNAIAAGASETAGGALLLAGAATPLAAASLIGTMITAIRKVHKPNGPWVAQGGWEYNAVLIAALMALVDSGPGPVSVDAMAGREQWGSLWALGGLALGAAASSVAVASGSSRAPAPDDAFPSPRDPVADAATSDTGGDPVTVES